MYLPLRYRTLRWNFTANCQLLALPAAITVPHSRENNATDRSHISNSSIAFVATFRSRNIRLAREYIAQTLNSEFPFAGSRPMVAICRLNTSRVTTLTCCWRLTPTDNWGGRRSLSPSSPNDYEFGLALVWHAAGRPPVLIDPRISFGAPMIKGVRVLKGRHEAGESIGDIRDDFSRQKKRSHGLE